MLALFGIDVGDLVSDAIRSLVDLLIPDFAAGWATSLVTSLVAVPDVTGSGFAQLTGLRQALTGVGFALLSLCLVAGGLQIWGAGVTQGGMRAGELVRRAVVAAGAMAVLPTLLRTVILGTNLATAELVQSDAVRHGLDSAFGEAFAFGAFTQGLSLGLAIPAAFGVAFFVIALLVMKAGLTALLAVLALASPVVLGLSPLPQARGLMGAWSAGLGAVLVVPVAWALVFSVAALLAGDALVLSGGPFESLAKPLAALACFWLAYRTPGFLLAAGRSVGLHPSAVLSAVPGRIGGSPGSGSGRGASGPGGAQARRAPAPGATAEAAKGRFAALVARSPARPSMPGRTGAAKAPRPSARAARPPAPPVAATAPHSATTPSAASPPVPKRSSTVPTPDARPDRPPPKGVGGPGGLVVGPRPPQSLRPPRFTRSPADPAPPRAFPSTTGQRPASGRPTPAASRARSRVVAPRALRPNGGEPPRSPRPAAPIAPPPHRPAVRPRPPKD